MGEGASPSLTPGMTGQPLAKTQDDKQVPRRRAGRQKRRMALGALEAGGVEGGEVGFGAPGSEVLGGEEAGGGG